MSARPLFALTLALLAACAPQAAQQDRRAPSEPRAAHAASPPAQPAVQEVQPPAPPPAPVQPPAAPAPNLPEPSALRECPPDMVPVPPGRFVTGTKGDKLSPLRKITLTKPYCIDRTEVSLEAYRRCESAGVCTETAAPDNIFGAGGPNCTARREGREKHPVNCINWFQAVTYCRWLGRRLPTEAEWEFAARGPKSLKFPWGNREPTDELAWNSMYITANRDYAKCADMGPEICPKRHHHVAWGTVEVGSRPKGASPFGVLDMGGNVSEWVQDWNVQWGGPALRDATDPVGSPDGTKRVLKDIPWGEGFSSSTVGLRHAAEPGDRSDDTGFRCAASLSGEATGPER